MAKWIFSLGTIDKKLFVPFLMAINQVIQNIIEYIYKSSEIPTSDIMDTFACNLGQMSIGLIPFIFKYERPKSLKDAIFNKKNMKYQAISWALVLIFSIFITGSAFQNKGDKIENPHTSLLCTKEAVEMIFLTIITTFALKYKYYLHNIISMIIFCLFSIFIDILLDNYESGLFKFSYLKIIFEILSIIAEICTLCYQVYMMRKLYYNYWSMCFSIGLFIFTMDLLTLIVCLIYGNPDGDKNFLNSIFYYFKEAGAGTIILRLFLEYVFFGFIAFLLKMLTLQELTANHTLISYEISKLSNILLQLKDKKKWYSIILFLFQFLGLMFFLEIFEYNFCGLNKNTAKNIKLREEIDMDMRDSFNSSLEIKGYIVKNNNEESQRKTEAETREMELKNDDTESEK